MAELPQIHLARGDAGCVLAGGAAALAIIVDALRASATIAALCTRGAGRVLVVARVTDARALGKQYPDALLVGERGCERLPGFDLGNSPLEVLASPPLDGRTVIFTSSNGAQRLSACLSSAYTLVGAPANAATLAGWVRRRAEAEHCPVVLIAAGKYPDEAFISPEDDATCAFLAMRTGLPIAPDSQEAFAHWEHELILRGLETIFRESAHARRLYEIGCGEDVPYCAQVDTMATLPAAIGPVMLDGRQVGVEIREMLARG